MAYRGTTKHNRQARHEVFREVIIEDPNGETAAYYRKRLQDEGGDLSGLPEPGAVAATADVPEPEVRASRGGGQQATAGRPEPKPTPGELRFIERLLEERELVHHLNGVNLNEVLLGKYRDGTLSKRQARELGDWLKGCPRKGQRVESETVARPAEQTLASANPRIVARGLLKLAKDESYDAETRALFDEAANRIIAREAEQVARQQAIRGAAAGEQQSTRGPRERVTEDGMYARTVDGERVFYKVQIAKQSSGRLYAKVLVQDEYAASGWSFEYRKGAIYDLTPADKLSLEEAKQFGQLYGVCCVCAAELTDEQSIAEGIGPVCGKRWG